MDTTRAIGGWILVWILFLSMVGLLADAVEAQNPNTNDPAYWETYFEHSPAWCGKHEGGDLLSNIHGYVTEDGLGVVLNPHQPHWFGDHWEGLVIKAGSGPDENTIYPHPVAGVRYDGNGLEVSHWIVCKGETPTTTTSSTTSSTTTSSTSTTSATTSTTIPSTTTTETTVPSSTTSTTDPTTTTTSTPTSTSTTVTTVTEPPTTVPPTTSTLPFTGPGVALETNHLLVLAFVLLLVGLSLWARYREE